MSNITATINLRNLKSAQMKIKSKSGDLVECVVIPIAGNYLIKGKEGAVYLNLIAFEMKEKKADRKDTHMVKQSIPKEDFEKFTDDEKNSIPILGNMIVWGQPAQQTNSFEAAPETNYDEGENLPF